ncbi:hypothetical protein [Bacillus mycoides]|uniref:hypothetical protein n=1 Tax=Bacillus mycoides TaxID=1405 RepID=UPI003A80407D
MPIFSLLVQIPKGVQMEDVKKHIGNVLEPYSERKQVDKQVYKTKEELRAEYETFPFPNGYKLPYKTWLEDWYDDMEFDTDGNVVSTKNPYGKWDEWSVSEQFPTKLINQSGENCVVARVKDINLAALDGFYTHSVLDESGRWFSSKHINYWAKKSGDEDSNLWKSNFIQRFIGCLDADDIVAIVHCHI